MTLLPCLVMRAAAIFGPGCGAEDLRPFQDGLEVDWHLGTPGAADRVDVVLLFGGDGTIHRHLAQLVKLGVPVLIVPTGSGNDFARALNLRRMSDSLDAWRKFCAARNGKQENVRAIDLGVITPLQGEGTKPSSHEVDRAGAGSTTYFCSVAGLGLDAEVARRANQLPRWLRGHGGYALSAASAIFQFAPLRVKILSQQHPSGHGESVWSTRSDRPTLLAAFANVPTYGGGMKIAPRAQVDDGQLDVCVIGALSALKLFCLFPTVYFGRHLKIKEVEYFQSSRVRIETERSLDIYADGEFVCQTPVKTGVEIGVARRALRVVTP